MTTDDKRSSQFVIDKDVPIPRINRGAQKYPFSQLEIGDSFFVPGKKMGTTARTYAARNNIKITIRAVVENGVSGLRVWRIAKNKRTAP